MLFPKAKVVNVSDKTGPKITGPVTSWQVPNGPVLVEHLAGPCYQHSSITPPHLIGDLILFFWGRDMTGRQLTSLLSLQKLAPVTSWTVPKGQVLFDRLKIRSTSPGKLYVIKKPCRQSCRALAPWAGAKASLDSVDANILNPQEITLTQKRERLRQLNLTALPSLSSSRNC